jgi:RNA polymerase sigma-70 factor (ECF subfamily)
MIGATVGIALGSIPRVCAGIWLALVRRTDPPEGEASPARGRADEERDARFEHFFRRYEPRITGYLWRMTGVIDLAADLCQETFLRAWQQFDTVAAYPQPEAWLFRVATNLALNQMRRPIAASLDPRFDPAGSDPSGRVVEREIVRQALLALPIKLRAPLILRAVYDLTYAEIGDLLAMSPDAVKMAVSRAREQFRQAYRRKDATY